MSDVNQVRFSVEQAVLDLGVKIVFPVVKGLDNTKLNPEWEALRKERIRLLLEEYREIDFHADPILEGFNLLHDRSGVKRRKNIPEERNSARRYSLTVACQHCFERTGLVDRLSMGGDADEETVQNKKQRAGDRNQEPCVQGLTFKQSERSTLRQVCRRLQNLLPYA